MNSMQLLSSRAEETKKEKEKIKKIRKQSRRSSRVEQTTPKMESMMMTADDDRR